MLIRETLSLASPKECRRLSAHALGCGWEGRERNPGLLGSSWRWDKPLCSICGVSR